MPSGLAARGGGCPRRRVNVLAFIQTGAALVLFQIHAHFCFFFSCLSERKRAENKIAGSTVLTNGAALAGGVLERFRCRRAAALRTACAAACRRRLQPCTLVVA